MKVTVGTPTPASVQKAAAQRDKIIVRTSIVGIIVNLLLSGFKAVVGLISSSIAIVLDAVNNLSDAASSVITIIGTKLAAKNPDKKHPFGYGRIEYLTSMVISVLVLYAGITALTESVKKIIIPEKPDYSTAALLIVAVGVMAKIALGLFVKSRGKVTKSDALVNSGTDALGDSIISAATLVSAIIFIIFKISLEAYLGAIISAVIIKSGIEMLRDATSKVLGEKAEPEIAAEVKRIINSFEEVHGTYDLIFNDYGAESVQASAHIEVDDTMTAKDIDRLVRIISATVYKKTGVILTAISIYALSNDEETVNIKNAIAKIVFSHGHINQLHGFYIDKRQKTIQFDIVIDFDEKDAGALCKKIQSEVSEKYPEYSVFINIDREFS